MKIVLFGASGKVGSALAGTLGARHEIVPFTSREIDAADLAAVRHAVESHRPEVVVNTVAFAGLDPCETDPSRAFLLNALLPRTLAGLSRTMGFVLVNYSTDAVFNDEKRGQFYWEDDTPHPMNVYGMTKYAGDLFVSGAAERYYTIRLGVVVGPSPKGNQFFERMLRNARDGRGPLRIANDIYSAPTYSLDAAAVVADLIETGKPFGLYHVANGGWASLYDLVAFAVKALKIDVDIEPVSCRSFPSLAPKNTWTPLASRRIALRPWQEAVAQHCLTLS